MNTNEFEHRLDEYFGQVVELKVNERAEFIDAVPEEYRSRLRELIEAFETTDSDYLVPITPSQFGNGIHQEEQKELLFLMLYWQCGLLAEQSMSAVLNEWLADRTISIDQVCARNKVLTPEQKQLIEPMVEAHVQLHNGEPGAALAAISSVPPAVRNALRSIPDQALQDSLAIVGKSSADGKRGSSFVRDENRFRILRKHASGGLGDVYIARDVELNRDVALKEIRSESADQSELQKRFQTEARITGRLEHPGIVPIYGLGQYPDGRPFYAMKFIDGDNLKKGIRQFHTTNFPNVSDRLIELRGLLRRLVDVCDAMAYAHSKGVLHRDLKPGNIMLGRYGETLVVDWGLARATDMDGVSELPSANSSVSEEEFGVQYDAASPTVTGSIIGTPQYMSPEQARGELNEISEQSDVYAIGAILYEILTGRPAIRLKKTARADQDLLAVLKLVRDGRIKPAKDVLPTVPPALSAICGKAMHLNKERRYLNTRELASDIEFWLADQPVSAWSEPVSVRVRRWVGQNQKLVSGLTTALIVGAVSLAVITNQSIKAATSLKAEGARTKAALTDAEDALQVAGNLLVALEEKPVDWFRFAPGSPISADEKLSIDRIADALVARGINADRDGDRRSGVLALFRGLRQIQQFDSAEAAQAITSAAKLLNDSRTATLFLTRVWLNQGNTEYGIPIALSASEKFPRDPDIAAIAADGFIMRALGRQAPELKNADLKKAKEYIDRSLKLAPENTLATIQLAEYLVESKQIGAAEQTLNRLFASDALDDHPQMQAEADRQNIYVLRELKRFDEAIQVSERLTTSPYARRHDFQYLAKNLYSLGRWEEAADAFLKTIELNDASGKPNWATNAELGQTYVMMQDYKKAVEAYSTIEHELADYPDPLVNYAVALTGAKQFDKAIQIYDDLRPDYYPAWMHYFECHYQQTLMLSGRLKEVLAGSESFPEEKLLTAYGAVHMALTRICAVANDAELSDLPYQSEWEVLTSEERFVENWNYSFLDSFIQSLPSKFQDKASEQLKIVKSKVVPR